MDSEVFARIRDYLADQLEVEPEKITPDSDIVNDFGADSLDVIDMITTLSDEFGVEIPENVKSSKKGFVACGCATLLHPSFGFTPSQKSTFSRLTTQKCTFLL